MSSVSAPPTASSRPIRGLRHPAVAVVLLALLYWACALRHVELPGIYMDAINPDYLAARWLHPDLPNTVWTMPGPSLPVLGNLYHGTQNLFAGLAVYSFLGTSVTSARIAHALFGCAIVILSFAVARRLTGRPWVALIAAAGLATDMAFIGSFRTQSYIVMGGQAWMLGGLLLALAAPRSRRPALLLLGSGVCMGLAVYGYFVHLFYAPMVATVAVFVTGDASRKRAATSIALWSAGFAVGLLPYAIGYVWALISLGGWIPFQEWLATALGAVRPTGAEESYLQGLQSSVRSMRLALSGQGNEVMMTGGAVSAGMDTVRLLLLAGASLACTGAAVVRWRHDRVQAWQWLCVALIAPVYLLVGSVFGSRLWMHHFTVMVAVGYLVMAVAIHAAASLLPRAGLRGAAGVSLAVALLWVNFQQQDRVFAALASTGGVGKSTEMLNVLSRWALSERDTAVYYFPEWGFFMPFAFLTGNQVAYELELSSGTIHRHYGLRDDLRIAFWDAKDKERYEALLRANGITDFKLQTYVQRDGRPAFHVLEARRAPW